MPQIRQRQRQGLCMTYNSLSFDSCQLCRLTLRNVGGLFQRGLLPLRLHFCMCFHWLLSSWSLQVRAELLCSTTLSTCPSSIPTVLGRCSQQVGNHWCSLIPSLTPEPAQSCLKPRLPAQIPQPFLLGLLLRRTVKTVDRSSL